MPNPDETLLPAAPLLAFLRDKMNGQRTKRDAKRREQRDADLAAGMYDEFSFIIDDIIDKVKRLATEWPAKQEKANDQTQQPPGAGTPDNG